MSIPVDALRFAGTWDVASTYKYAMVVLSPIDTSAYVWIGSQPVVGGSDPSVPNPDWVFIPPIATGDITGVIAGTGLSGGGSSGVVTVTNTGIITATAGTGISNTGTATDPIFENTGIITATAGTGISNTGTATDPIFENTGVLSLNGKTGAVTTTCGIYTEPTGGSDVAVISIPGLTTAGIVIVTYIHNATAGATQYFRSIVPTADTLTVTCEKNIDVGDQLNWFVANL